MTDKERYATANTWTEILQKEGFKIDDLTIRRRLEGIEAVAITGRTQVGRLVRDGFYAESDVRKGCADLLEAFPQADANNIIHLDGEEYRTLAGWSKELGLSSSAKVGVRFKRAGVKGIRGRMIHGNIRRFYSESDFRSNCSDITQDLPQADEKGFVEKDGVSYAPRRILSEHLGLSENIIERAIQESRPDSITGLSRIGHLVQFHSENEVRAACSDYLGLSQANEAGIFVINGELYRQAKDWAVEYGVHPATFAKKAKRAGVSPIKGRVKTGRISNFFAESDVGHLFAEVFDAPLEVGNDEVIEHEGKTYATAIFFADKLNLSAGFVSDYLKRVSVKRLKVRTMKRIRTYVYLCSEAECELSSYTAEMPQASTEGYFDKDGERYWSVDSWSRSVGIAVDAVRRKMTKQATAIKGKVAMGKTAKFYPTSSFEEHCSDLRQEYFRVDEDDCLEIDGEEYRTLSRLGKMLGLSEPSISTRIKRAGLTPIKAKSTTNRLFDYYPVSIVRELCSDMLAPLPQADKSGLIKIDGETYGTISVLAELLGVSKHLLPVVVKESQPEVIKGKSRIGRICDYYRLSDIRELSTNLVDKRRKK